MTTNPAEIGPHAPDAPTTPEAADVETEMPGVDPDWSQTAEPGPSDSGPGQES